METMTTNIPFQHEQPIFGKVGNIAELIHMNPEDRQKYNISIDTYRTNLSVMKNERAEGEAIGMKKGRAEGEAIGMKKGRAEGEAIGMKKGEAVGMKKGEAIGMKKGRAEGRAEGERQKALAIAQSLKAAGMPLGQIAQITGLDEAEIS